MARPSLRALCAAAGLAAASIALTTCSDESPGPNRPGMGTVVLLPRFAPGVSPAAVSLFIDNVHLTLIRPPDEVVLDTIVPFSLDSATLRIQLRVNLEAVSESLDAALELRAGGVVLFTDTVRILVTQGGPPAGPPPTMDLRYVGPGAQIASLQVVPRDTFLRLGDSLAYQVQALDSQGTTVSQFYVSWRTSGAASLINAGGLLRVPNARGNTYVVAVTPTGVKDSTPVGFVPQATALVLTSGNNQPGTVQRPLPQPLVVQVRAADGLGVGGVAVQFSVQSGGGQVSPSDVVSDDQGFAQASATLGISLGIQSFRAIVTGLPPVIFSATATAGAATQISANSPLDQSATVSTAVAAPPSVLVQDASGNPVQGHSVSFVVTAGGGTVVPTTPVLTSTLGVAQSTSWTLGPTPGPNALEARAPGLTGSPVSFTATGLAGGAGRLGFAVAPPASGQAGEPLTPAPVIQVQDASGNPVNQAGVSITAAIASGGGTLFGSTTSVTGSNGQATFANLRIGGFVGPRTLTFSATGLTNVTSGTIDLVAGAAAQLLITTQPSLVAQSGVVFPVQPVIQIADGSTNPVSQNGVPIAAAIVQGSGVGTLGGNDTVLTDASGRATFSGLSISGPVQGYTLGFSASGLTGIESSVIALQAGPAAVLSIETQPPATATSGAAFSTQPVVRIRDAAGNTVNQSGTVITAVVASSPGGSPTLASPTATTNSSGIATFSGLGITGQVGNYTLSFTASGLTAATSNTILLGAGAVSASQSSVSATPASIVADGVSQATVTVTARDAAGNGIAGANVVLSVSGSGNSITQPPPTNVSGVAQGSFRTTTAEIKTVSALINSVAITQTATVTATLPPQIVFNGDSLGFPPQSGIFRVNANGSGRAQLTPEGPTGVIRARFSIDRSRITYSATPGFPNPNQLHVASVSPLVVAHLTTPTDTGTRQPRYNPTGQHLAFSVGNEFSSDQDVVVIANVNTATIPELDAAFGRLPTVFITDGQQAGLGGSGAFAWDPQSQTRLAFVRDLTPFGLSLIFTSEFDGSGATAGQVLYNGVDSIRVDEMSWSPDGSFLVFSAQDLRGSQQALFRIDRNLDVQTLRRITTPPTSPFQEDTRPVVSPDGAEILFLRSSI
ncbi:MAG: Ig-like domain-containing protein, partial [Gemmatimonadales bacterium]